MFLSRGIVLFHHQYLSHYVACGRVACGCAHVVGACGYTRTIVVAHIPVCRGSGGLSCGYEIAGGIGDVPLPDRHLFLPVPRQHRRILKEPAAVTRKRRCRRFSIYMQSTDLPGYFPRTPSSHAPQLSSAARISWRSSATAFPPVSQKERPRSSLAGNSSSPLSLTPPVRSV